jgi:hypothetical protein
MEIFREVEQDESVIDRIAAAQCEEPHPCPLDGVMLWQ